MDNLEESPMVSVVIPTIRFDTFTEKALLSVFAQKYQSWEIILVLDGAQPSEVASWVLDSPRVRLVEHKDRMGTPLSLNDGASLASGKYIARLDADDIAHPDRLALQVELLENNPEVCCVGTAGYLINEEGVDIGELVASPATSDVRELMLVKNPMIHSSVMYKKDVFARIGGYGLKMKRSQDYDLFLRMAQEAPLAYMDQMLCAYRVHKGQHSRKTSPFANYTFELLTQRKALARKMNVSSIAQVGRNFIWYVAQVLRYAGLRRVGYLKGAEGRVPQLFEWLDPRFPES